MDKERSIWVDADSCPRQVRDIIVRASGRTGLPSIFVSNRQIPLDASEKSCLLVVENGETADDVILEKSDPGDLVITRDIPLAARLLEKSCIVLNDRGVRFLPDTIRERLSLRNLMKDFREAGILEEAKRSFGPKEIGGFAAAFDRELTALLKP